jgi:hypothetical protein
VVTATGQITITGQALGFTINLGTSTIYPTSGSSVRITPVTKPAPTISTSRPVSATITPVRLASTQIANTITRSPNVSFVNRSTTVINPTVQIAPSMRILFLSAPPTITTPTGPTVIPDTYVDAYQDAY